MEAPAAPFCDRRLPPVVAREVHASEVMVCGNIRTIVVTARALGVEANPGMPASLEVHWLRADIGEPVWRRARAMPGLDSQIDKFEAN